MSVHVEDLADAYAEIARLRSENGRLTSALTKLWLSDSDRAALHQIRSLVTYACEQMRTSPLIKSQQANVRRGLALIDRLLTDDEPTR